MSYVVLARKWRPMTFDDLVGQGHVSKTLARAIASGRIAHAFLFTGVRGVGKTTAARILAKSLNCMGPPDAPADGPRATPCLECPACREIATGADMDVREIDGASYNGVDEVRKLQDSLPYRPNRDRYKVIIVDEVHMLSQSAWNAFLKTLEEPPPHVKFIFATTEVHKVPVTILSRVQRFDFKLIPTQLIVQRLRYVLDAEGIPADDTALSIIAREAAGSMRDAMSVLDQVIAWNDQKLEGDGVARVLGVASRQVLHDLARALVEGRPERCLFIVSDLGNQGYDISTVARDLLSLLRDLVVAKVCDKPDELLELADEERKDVVALSESNDADDLVRLHQGFSSGFDEVIRSGQPRAALEMLLVRLARRPPLIAIDDLVLRLASLEKKLQGAPPPDRGGGPRSGPGRGSPQQQPRRAAPRETRTASARSSAQGSESAAEEPPPAPPELGPTRRPLATPRGAGPSAHTRRLDGAPHGTPPLQSTETTPARALTEAQPGAEPKGPGTEGERTSSPVDLGKWRAIVERIGKSRPELAAYLSHVSPLAVGPEGLAVGVEAGGVFEQDVTSRESKNALEQAASEEFARPISVRFESLGKIGATLSEEDHRKRAERRQAALTRAEDHPFVGKVQQLLGAKLKEVRLPDD